MGKEDLAKQVQEALHRSAVFFRSISTHGGYLWQYSEDLKERWGEVKATETQIWVQPPGTPSVGQAFLRAYEVTKDKFYLEAAKEAAEALVWGQLESGGWDYRIDFDPKASQRWYFRRDKDKIPPEKASKRRNITVFDDNTTQSALRFLMAAAQSTKDKQIQEAVDYGLQGLLKAQYPNGAFPQGYPAPKDDYSSYYTFNDNCIVDCIYTLLDAWQRYHKKEYLEAARRGGDFILSAQLPEPHPVWAQQYDFALRPAWARKFEPPAACSSESVGIIRCLIELYLVTGEEKYLKPLPAAIKWFKRSQIAPNRWARFYELETNKPLYFTKEYKLTYDDQDLPTHYSFQGEYGIPAMIKWYEEVKGLGRKRILAERQRKPTGQEKEARRHALEPRVRDILASLDEKGRWLTNGRIESETFIRNLKILCDYLEACPDERCEKNPHRYNLLWTRKKVGEFRYGAKEKDV